MLTCLVGLRGQTAGTLSVQTPRSHAGTHRDCPAQTTHIHTHIQKEREFQSATFNACEATEAPPTQLSRLVKVTNATNLFDKMFCPFLLAAHKQTNQDTCSTEIWHHPCLFPPFIPLSDYCKFYFLKVPFGDNPPSSPPALHSTSILFFLPTPHFLCITSVFLLLPLQLSD